MGSRLLSVGVAAFSILVASAAHAAIEARCVELGANCTCSEPLDTDTYTMVPGVSWGWNPADTGPSDKECNTSGQQGAFVEIDGFPDRFTTVSDGAPLSALPPGHTNARVLRLKDGAGGMFAGVKFNHGEPHARRGFRYYKYYSLDYSFTADVPLCNSSKWGQMGFNGAGTGGPLMTEDWSFYDIATSTGWNQDATCCSAPGPGHLGLGPSLSAVKGKWIRFEFYMNNTDTSGVPTTFEAYLKNVTDDTPEVRLVDSSVPADYPNGENWTTAHATTLHPTQPITDMSINMFRSNNGQACIGYAAFAYFMAAAWNTNAGQRIDAAREIEGMAASSTDAGSPPSDVGNDGGGGGGGAGAASSNAGPPGDDGSCTMAPSSARHRASLFVLGLGALVTYAFRRARVRSRDR